MSGDEVQFGRFRLDLKRRELWRDETLMRLGSRVVDVLCVLVSAKGEVVTKDELMARVWSGVVVEDSNIHVHVSALKKGPRRRNQRAKPRGDSARARLQIYRVAACTCG